MTKEQMIKLSTEITHMLIQLSDKHVGLEIDFRKEEEGIFLTLKYFPNSERCFIVYFWEHDALKTNYAKINYAKQAILEDDFITLDNLTTRGWCEEMFKAHNN